jgi:hypothetical protein
MKKFRLIGRVNSALFIGNSLHISSNVIIHSEKVIDFMRTVSYDDIGILPLLSILSSKMFFFQSRP